MKFLSEYIYCAFIASLAAGVAERLSASSSMKKYVRLISSLILLLLLATPLQSLAETLSSFSPDAIIPESGEETKDSYNYLMTQVSENVEKTIQEDIQSAFSLTKTCEIECEMLMEEEGLLLIVRIEIFLPETYSELARNIQEYAEAKYRANTIVTLKGEAR